MKDKIIGCFLAGVMVGICIMGIVFISYLGGEFTHKLKDTDKSIQQLEIRLTAEENRNWFGK